MFIHRENALKAHYHAYIIHHFKKTMLIQNLIFIFTKTHQIAHLFKIFSQGIKPPSMCAADIILSI